MIFIVPFRDYSLKQPLIDNNGRRLPQLDAGLLSKALADMVGLPAGCGNSNVLGGAEWSPIRRNQESAEERRLANQRFRHEQSLGGGDRETVLVEMRHALDMIRSTAGIPTPYLVDET